MSLLKILRKARNKATENTNGNIVMVVLNDGTWLIGKLVHENRYYLHLRVDNHYIPIYKKTIRKVYR